MALPLGNLPGPRHAVNSYNNNAFTPTVGFNAYGFNVSVGYNTQTGSTTMSLGYGYGGLGANASVTFDNNGCFAGGSIGISASIGSGFNAGIGASVGWGYYGVYTGISVNGNAGYGYNGGYFNIGASLTGSYTWNANGTTSWSVGAGINGGYAGATVSTLGMCYNNDNKWTMMGSGGYDDKQANDPASQKFINDFDRTFETELTGGGFQGNRLNFAPAIPIAYVVVGFLTTIIAMVSTKVLLSEATKDLDNAAEDKAEKALDTKSSTGKKIKDIQDHPENWEKVGYPRPDSRQPKDGSSTRQRWRNKDTGVELDEHNLIKNGKPAPKHPHYTEPKGD